MRAACESRRVSDPLTALQNDVYHALRSEPGFRFAQIVLQRPRDEGEAVLIQQAVDGALAGFVYADNQILNGAGTDAEKAAQIAAEGKAGLCIEVIVPDGEVPNPEAPGPQLEAVLHVKVTENPLVNFGARGTELTAEQCSLDILSAFHHWNREGMTLTADKKALRENEDDSAISYSVVFRQKIAMPKQLRAAAPAITYSGGNVTLTAESGAAIYSTTDGTPPMPSNPLASLYAAPFAASAGVTVRAAAVVSGKTVSPIASLLLS